MRIVFTLDDIISIIMTIILILMILSGVFIYAIDSIKKGRVNRKHRKKEIEDEEWLRKNWLNFMQKPEED